MRTLNLTDINQIPELIQNQRNFFSKGESKDPGFRISMLRKLKEALQKYQAEIEQALYLDLGKSAQEAFLTEIALVNLEIDFQLRHLKKWCRPKAVPYSLATFPSRSYIQHEPLGVVLIMAPWNYPFQLLVNPLVAAIAAGNCVVLKPSPLANETAILVEKIIASIYPSDYITVVQGDVEENKALLDQRFDLIFFTGSTRVGKLVMQAAAQFLTPVVLELGGKSPVVISKNANLNLAARRIIWGKLINSGQTCVAPDYVLLEKGIKNSFVKAFKQELDKLYGNNPIQSNWYPKIISDAHFQRLESLLNGAEILFESERNRSNKQFGPVLVEMPKDSHPLAEEEIFGPILPILEIDSLTEAISYITKREKPLALYFFGTEEEGTKLLQQTSSGGACINETLVHLANHHLPFGGVGQSGMGAYHGYEGFRIFSHRKAFVKGITWIDLPFRYPPFKFFKWLKKFL